MVDPSPPASICRNLFDINSSGLRAFVELSHIGKHNNIDARIVRKNISLHRDGPKEFTKGYLYLHVFLIFLL